MNALGIPTTRTLAMVLYPTLPVRREDPTPEKAAVVTRIAPSFIRIGNFEGLSPPTNAYSFSFTGQQVPLYICLWILSPLTSATHPLERTLGRPSHTRRMGVPKCVTTQSWTR
jgi:protein adenylyltransferase